MKKFIFILVGILLALGNKLQSQPQMPIDEATKLVTYQEDVIIEGAKKEELFNKCISKWLNKFYANPTGVTHKRDLESGIIEGTAKFKIYGKDKKGQKNTLQAGEVSYTIQLRFKDGKYRVTLTKINWKQPSYYPIERWLDPKTPGWKPEFNDYLEEVDEYMRNLMKDLKEKMTEKEIKKVDDF